MKKIFVAVVIAASAVVANAAAMNWGADYTYASDGTGVAGDSRGTTAPYIAYVFDASTYAYSAAQAAFAANDSATLVANALGSAPVSADDLGGFQAQSTFAGAGGDSITAYVLIFDAATVADARNMYLSETQTAVAPTSGVAGQLSFGENGDMVAMASASNWTTTAVPEPTSGLLLLLGMAGLALRRKRA